jgi:hypothetical protein
MPKTTSRPIVREHNSETNEIIDREMNDAEFEAHLAQVEARKVADEAKAKAEADKAALLARLGLTADEAKLLLG